jgi:hypothetical protein
MGVHVLFERGVLPEGADAGLSDMPRACRPMKPLPWRQFRIGEPRN